MPTSRDQRLQELLAMTTDYTTLGKVTKADIRLTN
jgi:hypothetical protein